MLTANHPSEAFQSLTLQILDVVSTQLITAESYDHLRDEVLTLFRILDRILITHPYDTIELPITIGTPPQLKKMFTGAMVRKLRADFPKLFERKHFITSPDIFGKIAIPLLSANEQFSCPIMLNFQRASTVRGTP